MKPSIFVRIPPPIWALLYIAIAFGVDRIVVLPAIAALHVPEAGIVLIASGFALALWAFALFRVNKTAIEPSSTTHAALVAKGPYRFTRNPMYLGLELFALGLALYSGSLALLAVPFVLFVTINWGTIPFEEHTMEVAFGESYRAYKEKVRRWI